MNKMTQHTGSELAKPDFLEGTGVGNENVTYQDLEIPRLGIVQDLSPQRKKSDPAYIVGAEEGMMFNTVTGELYKEPLMVLPVFYRKEWVVWVDRKAGGGFRGSFDNQVEAEAMLRSMDDPATVVETAQNFCLISSDKGSNWSEAVLSMSKSGLGVARKWNSMIQLRKSDRFGQVYWVAPVQKTNPKGSYYVFGINWAQWATKEWYEAGKASYESIKGNSRSVAMGSSAHDQYAPDF